MGKCGHVCDTSPKDLHFRHITTCPYHPPLALKAAVLLLSSSQRPPTHYRIAKCCLISTSVVRSGHWERNLQPVRITAGRFASSRSGNPRIYAEKLQDKRDRTTLQEKEDPQDHPACLLGYWDMACSAIRTCACASFPLSAVPTAQYRPCRCLLRTSSRRKLPHVTAIRLDALLSVCSHDLLVTLHQVIRLPSVCPV